MKILSLDLSTKSSGWAVFEEGHLLSHGCITSSSTAYFHLPLTQIPGATASGNGFLISIT